LILRSEDKEWLLIQLPEKVVTLTLLFRGSTHGWSPSVFHQLCVEKGPTITIFKSSANRVFGGFIQNSWKKPWSDNSINSYSDEKAFIYSIDRKQIFRVIHSGNAVFYGSSLGPSFGGKGL
jgi:hypothetical protein